MARILNLVIVILEVVSLSKTFKERGFKKNFVFYTQLSNMMTFFASLLLVIFGQKDWVEVLRFLSVSMLVMTFFVTACILAPWARMVKELLLSGSGLYHHTIIPILSTLTYMLFEKRAPFYWIWLPGLMTLIYGLAMNERITTFEDVYYFAYPCDSTMIDENGELRPDPAITENMFMKSSIYACRYTGTTAGGFRVDESWQPNDGLVNTVSAKAPIGAPSVEYTKEQLTGGAGAVGVDFAPGIWNVMPTRRGDHMSLQGGMFKRVKVKDFYLELAGMLAVLGD